MTETISFRVVGIPGAQGSKTMTRWGAMREASKKVKPWRQDIKYTAYEYYKDQPISVPVKIKLEFIFPRPKSHFGSGKNSNKLKTNAPKFLTSSQTGDIDKLCRSTLDGLSAKAGGSVIADDSLVVCLFAQKRYAKGEELPGAEISVTPLSLSY